jgi:hypothetical protein
MDGLKNLQLYDFDSTSCQLFKFNYIRMKSAMVLRFAKKAGIFNKFCH